MLHVSRRRWGCARSADGESVPFRAYRWLVNCQRSVTVDRATRGDSLLRRFVLSVGRDLDIACPAAPAAYSFAETVSVSTGRTATYVVRQPDGSSLVERLTAP
jgi:hypothetical protein